MRSHQQGSGLPYGRASARFAIRAGVAGRSRAVEVGGGGPKGGAWEEPGPPSNAFEKDLRASMAKIHPEGELEWHIYRE